MDHRPRGRAVVISNRYFVKANLEVRYGAEYDEQNIQYLFTMLHFDVYIHTNKSASVRIVCFALDSYVMLIISDIFSMIFRFTTFCATSYIMHAFCYTMATGMASVCL